MNNHYKGKATKNALMLIKLLRKEASPINKEDSWQIEKNKDNK
jgi:uncharacterized protein YecE (DUF72 family)